jgi:formylmethanofuran dehydrogenase subunit D
MTDVGVKILVTTGRTLAQGRAMELGKLSKEYQDAVAVCEVSSTVLEVLGIADGDSVRVESPLASVVVRAKLNRRAEPSVAFMPCGPYANMLTGSYTEESGMPEFKGIQCTIFAASSERILTPAQLLGRITEGDA